MIWFYRALFVPALLLASPYYLLRMKKRGGYGRNFTQRFGSVNGLPAKRTGVRRIWLQAVSVGEMLAIAPILEALKKDPSIEVYLTTTTSTGFKLANERYQNATIGIGYFPLDWWLFSARAWKQVQPDLVILTEGERWPEHTQQARRRGVQVVCINARLSDVSFSRMKAAKWATHSMFSGITRVLPCSEHDAARFRELGFPPDRINVTGNIKLDLTIPSLSDEGKAKLRSELGFGSEPILLGSSTWPGEELAVVEAYKRLRTEGVNCRLLIVPRHAERRGEVEDVVRGSGLNYHFRSRGLAAQPVEICVADTTGELRKLSQLAAVIFVGKSLPPHDQGQTPVEAAALGKPILFGPKMTNFFAIAEELKACGAARVVHNADDLFAEAKAILADPAKGEAMSAAARAWHRANQGAVSRTLEIVRQDLGQK
ncbi:MAG: glycosyltransferase N-terminal domain-containing protein [Nibricoccus sp.]